MDRGRGKSTSYFLNLEKKHQQSNVINSIKYQDKTANEDSGILELCTAFYKNLYSSSKIPTDNIKDHLKDINVNKLSEQNKFVKAK